MQALERAASVTVSEGLRAGADLLHKAGIDSARLDAEVLLRHVLGVEKAEFYLGFDAALDATAERDFQMLLLRRARREPVAYITGRKEFWSLDFVVTPQVLIPRPETELLVERALELSTGFSDRATVRILDLGTGSGAIAVSLAKELPLARIFAVDISAAALNVARVNSERHGEAGRMRFLRSDLFEVLDRVGEKFDLIVSNPPYIRSAELLNLAPEIRQWEPITALDGGADGLDYYRRIIREAHGYLTVDGQLLLEIGEDMAEAVTQMIAHAGCYQPAAVYKDCAGNDRVIAASKTLALRGVV